jgi:signal transduction histidine kinase/CheY-like chemotaxis protein
LSTVGLISVFCAGLYVTMMAFYYGRIVASNSELEHEVQRHEQTAVMLLEARDASEAANRAKSEFLATMGHELRTPLNAVIGFSQVMVKELYGPLGHENYKDYAKDIQDSGSHLLEIINDILDISKAEFGAVELDDRLLDCHALIVSSCRLVRSRLEKSRLTLNLRLPKPMPQLRADPRMFKRILLKLLTNAIKFTPPDGRIEVEVAADPRAGLFVTVRDTGIGIAAGDLSRVRKAFVQGDSALSRRHEGIGLGLPLVEMMMRQHAGTLQLESVERKGTTARLLFPAERLVWSGAPEADAPADSARALETDPDTAPMAARPAEPPRLLVVEDDKDLCDLLRRMLERAGFSTAGASNGREALRHLKTEPVDLLITDMVMPEMDGVELMRILRKNRPKLPIIALSGVENFKEYRRISTHLGAQAALHKPVSRVDLIRAVNDVLAGRPSDDV